MIEIFSIFISLLTFVVITIFPINYFKYEKILNGYKINFFDILLVNLILFLNLLLIFSFFSINLRLIFLFYILICIFYFFFYFKKYFFYLIKNKSIFFLFFLMLFLLFLSIAQTSILTWDGAAHWFFKAQNFFQGSEYKNLVNLPMNYYPHLGSYVWAFFWQNSFLRLEYFGRFFYVFLFVVSMFSLGQQLNKSYSIIEKLFIIFALTTLSTNFFLFGGYQEYLIFFIFFVFSRFFFLVQINDKSNIFILFLLLLSTNLLLWIKQEGFFYFIFLNLIFFFHYKKNFYHRYYFIIVSLILLLFFLVVKIYFFGSLRFGEGINPNFIDNLNFIIFFKKVVLILKYFLISFFKYPIFILVILSTIILFFKYNFFREFTYLYTFIFLTFAFIFLIYINTKDDLIWTLPLTLSRLVFPISGFLIFLIIELLNKLKESR